jgi:hypothetical protein
MEFASEMVIKSTIAGFRVTEVPTTLSPDGRSRPPHLRSWRDGWRHLKLLLVFAPHWLFLYPGAALAGFGALLAAVLLPGPLTIGQLKLDSATILFALAAVLVGAQMIMFYLVARLHSVTENWLPASPRFARVQHVLTVDRFCLTGAILFVAGLFIAGAATLRWVHADFGDLNPSLIVRFAAVSTAAIALGVQTVTTGFLMELIRNRGERSDRTGRKQISSEQKSAESPASKAAA